MQVWMASSVVTGKGSLQTWPRAHSHPQACRARVALELLMPLMEALCERQVSHMSHGHSWLLVTILQGTWKVDLSRVWSVSGIADCYIIRPRVMLSRMVSPSHVRLLTLS